MSSCWRGITIYVLNFYVVLHHHLIVPLLVHAFFIWIVLARHYLICQDTDLFSLFLSQVSMQSHASFGKTMNFFLGFLIESTVSLVMTMEWMLSRIGSLATPGIV